MRFVQSDPSALYGRAFCLSSVRLFCGTNVDSSCEIAGHVEQNGRILGSSLCIAEARGDTTRVWIPYIEVASADSAVLMRLVEGMRQHFASTPIFSGARRTRVGCREVVAASRLGIRALFSGTDMLAESGQATCNPGYAFR